MERFSIAPVELEPNSEIEKRKERLKQINKIEFGNLTGGELHDLLLEFKGENEDLNEAYKNFIEENEDEICDELDEGVIYDHLYNGWGLSQRQYKKLGRNLNRLIKLKKQEEESFNEMMDNNEKWKEKLELCKRNILNFTELFRDKISDLNSIELLKKRLDDVIFIFIKNPARWLALGEQDPGKIDRNLAFYDSKENIVFINTLSKAFEGYDEKDPSEHLITHELLHAISYTELWNYEDPTEEKEEDLRRIGTRVFRPNYKTDRLSWLNEAIVEQITLFISEHSNGTLKVDSLFSPSLEKNPTNEVEDEERVFYDDAEEDENDDGYYYKEERDRLKKLNAKISFDVFVSALLTKNGLKYLADEVEAKFSKRLSKLS